MDREKFLPNITAEDRKLIKLFQEEVNRINLLYLKAIHSDDITKANQLLKQMKSISNYLSKTYGEWADIRIPQEYVKGSSYIDDVLKDTAVLELGEKAIETYLEDLGPIHIEAVNALLNNSKNYVKSSLDGMERQALTMINELQQEKVREELAKGVISGEARMNDRLVKYFTDNGINGFKDRGGKFRSMDRYVDMLVRTETSIANTQGTINRALELGITKFEIVEHPTCCKECAELNGNIVDISQGTVELPPFHPNCRGYVIAVIDEGTEDNKIEIPQPKQKEFELTKDMKEDQYIQKAISVINKKYKGKEPKIGYDNAVAVSSFSTELYKYRNKWLRGGDIEAGFYPQLTDSVTKTIAQEETICNETLYRGTPLPKDVFDNMVATNKYTDKGFMSFSTSNLTGITYANNDRYGDKVAVVFELENGKGLDMAPYTVYSHENEYLLNKDTSFDVLSVEKNGFFYKVKIKQL